MSRSRIKISSLIRTGKKEPKERRRCKLCVTGKKVRRMGRRDASARARHRRGVERVEEGKAELQPRKESSSSSCNERKGKERINFTFLRTSRRKRKMISSLGEAARLRPELNVCTKRVVSCRPIGS